MSYLKSFLVAAIFFMVANCAFSQSVTTQEKVESNQTQISQSPQVSNTVTSGGQLTSVTAKVIELADGDNQTAEKVVRYLKVDRVPTVTKIITDEEYHRLEGNIPDGVISESEVLELINEFK